MKQDARILMVSTSPDAMGGISAVLSVYREGGLFERWPITQVITHRDGGAAVRIGTASAALLKTLWGLAFARPALMHLHVASRGSFWRKSIFMGLAQLFRVPYLLHLHGAEFQLFYGSECGPVARRAVEYFFDRAACVIVLSEHWRDWVKSMCTNPRIERIFNPVIIPHQAVPFADRETGTLLLLGRLGERKGVYDLLHAVQRLIPRFPQLRLLLGGDGELDKVRATAAGLGIAQNVEVLGWVGAERKRDLLSIASVYVLPSYNEGLPMSVLEAMASGLPIVSTPVGGIPEAVHDGVEGLIIRAGDIDALTEALGRLLDNDALRKRMGKAARARAESTFSSASVLSRVEQLYREHGAYCSQVTGRTSSSG